MSSNKLLRRNQRKVHPGLALFLPAVINGPAISLADDPASSDGEAELAKKLQNPIADVIRPDR